MVNLNKKMGRILVLCYSLWNKKRNAQGGSLTGVLVIHKEFQKIVESEYLHRRYRVLWNVGL